MGVGLECYRVRIGTFMIKNGFKIKSMKQGFNVSRKLSNLLKRGAKTPVTVTEILICILFYTLAYSFFYPRNSPFNIISENVKCEDHSNSTIYWLSMKQINKIMHTLNGNRRNIGYKYFAWNCDRGYLSENKLEDVKQYALRHNPNSMGISEVNFVRNENNRNEHSKVEFSTEQLMEIFQIPGYNIILPESWTEYNKARIILYVNSEMNIKVCRLENNEKHLQIITLEIGFGRSRKHFLSFYYREWTNMVTGLGDKQSQNEDLTKLTNIWRRFTSTDRDFVSLGDMNICSKRLEDENYAHSDLADILQEFLLSENCSQLVNQFTRIRSVNGIIQRSCLDHIISNCVSKMSQPEIHGVGKSDHLGISISRSSKEIRPTARTTKKRVYKHFDKDAFQTEMKNAKAIGVFREMFECEDIDDAVKVFTEGFRMVLDKHAPLKIIQNRVNYQPYVSEDIRKEMSERDLLKEKAAESGNSADYENYKIKRNLVTYKMRTAVKSYYCEKFSNEQASSSEMWKDAYSALGRFCSQFPTQIVVFGKLISKPIEIATEMNAYFIKKISDLKPNSHNK